MPDLGKPLSEAHRVYELLSSAIRRGRVGASDALDVADLMERFGATRNAVRSALAMLAEDGVLERAPRRGTHVTAHLGAVDLGRLRTHRNLALPLREVFVQEVGAPAVVADRFGIGDGGESVLLVERLLGNAGTLCLETTYIRGAGREDAHRFLDAGRDALRTHVPLDEYVREVFDDALVGVDLSVQVTTARPRVAELLELQTGTPVFLIERVLRGPGGVHEISFATSEAQHSYLVLDG